jgi:hypothetical protein
MQYFFSCFVKGRDYTHYKCGTLSVRSFDYNELLELIAKDFNDNTPDAARDLGHRVSRSDLTMYALNKVAD